MYHNFFLSDITQISADEWSFTYAPYFPDILRAYSFGHLKSAKSSENGGLCREKFQLPKEWEF